MNKKLNRNVGGVKTRLTAVLSSLLNFLPKQGQIAWDKEGDDGVVISIGPTPFMTNIDPCSANVKVEKREFWNKDCTEYIVTYDNGNYILKTSMDRSLPRDAKWLDSRR